MKLKFNKYISIFIIIFLNSYNAYPQWVQNAEIEGGDVRALVYDGSRLFCGLSEDGVHISDDNGKN